MSSKIEWTDETWNPVRGCRRVSPGCQHCYAERMARRQGGPGGAYEGLTVLGADGPRWTGEVRLVPEKLEEPLRWRKPRRVFVNSMSDLFHEDVPEAFIRAVIGVMAVARQHTFQVLTKRPARMAYVLRRSWRDESVAHAWRYLGALGSHRIDWATVDEVAWPPPNVWWGTSVEDQQRADERIPLLLQCPAAVRWVSAEPLLGPVDLGGEYLLGEYAPRDFGGAMAEEVGPRLDWVVVGGESGPGARPFDLEWGRSIVEQCRDAGVPVFVKQLGARPVASQGPVHLVDRKGGDPSEWPEDLRVREWPVSAGAEQPRLTVVR